MKLDPILSLNRRRIFEIAALLLILSLAAYLRLANRTDNPGWYSDEGTQLDIAQHLRAGRVQYLALGQSVLLVGRLPLFSGVLAGALALTGAEGDAAITVLRGLTGWLGVLTVGLLYIVARRSTNAGFALLAALMLALYPQAALYSRFGFSYNLLAPLAAAALLGLWEYLQTGRRGWLALAALATGLGALCDVMGLVFAVPLALVVPVRRRRDLLWCLPLAALPLGVYAALMLLTAPQAFLFDAGFTLSRLGGSSLYAQAGTLAQNYTVLLSQDFWILAGVAGLVVLRPARLGRLSLLMLFVPLLLIGRVVALYSLSAYYMIPLLPFVALGAAALVWQGAPAVWRAAYEGLDALLAAWGMQPGSDPVRRQIKRGVAMTGAAASGALLILTPLLTSLSLTLNQAATHFSTAIDPFLLNPDDARRAAAFVNARRAADDLVIASPALAWLIQGNVADFQMSIAAAGTATPHLPGDIPNDRFVFDPRHPQARFIVVDNLWHNWGEIHIPGVSNILQAADQWPLVFASGSIAVYHNPALP
ncbi:MAG: glycosyltransferase family 39 protein [Anaerolineae bacterium]|nr:glycosyltransferase family 39 protein [Anaerolineae bacterium]